jgi:tetrapyrrole methylase family protein/MazG family protein
VSGSGGPSGPAAQPPGAGDLSGSGGPSGPAALPVVTVVGLGPAGPDLVTAATTAAIAAHGRRWLRTARHPAASLLAGAPTFDDEYERAERLDEVYPAIAERLVAEAVEHGAVLYAVPGSPVVAERTVELLRSDPRVRTVMQPALSFLDLAWVRLGVDPVALGVRVVDGHRFEVEAAGERGPLLVGQCDSDDVLAAVKLALGEAIDLSAGPDDLTVTVLQRLGLPDEAVTEVRWDDLDRTVEPDHLTSVWIPAHAPPVAAEVQRFVELTATLRRECPWDRAQTHQSLERHLLEEAYEVLDALGGVDPETGEGYDHLEEELGDLLFQILFHATLAAEAGQFTLADVARAVHDKMRARHPHVFGDVVAADADAVVANWEELKQREKGRRSVFDGVPEALPALLLALKIQEKGAKLGPGRAVDLEAAVARARTEPSVAAVGDLLWGAVRLAGEAGIEPESALRRAALAERDAWRATEG